MIIAVDGYSSTGKSTVAKILAAELSLIYIDTGAMYRVVTLAALRRDLIHGETIDKEALYKCLKDINIGFKYNADLNSYETYLNGEFVEEQIRSMHVSDQVSGIAAIDFVRDFLVAQQREMGERESIIMDGRDIGSVVFPNADLKFFMTSSPEVRALRRYKEMEEKGVKVSYEEVEANVRKRDYIDTHREVSPLLQTDDAIVVDSSEMTIEEVVELMVSKIKEIKI